MHVPLHAKLSSNLSKASSERLRDGHTILDHIPPTPLSNHTITNHSTPVDLEMQSFTVDSECVASRRDSDSLSAQGTDTNQGDDGSIQNEPHVTIWGRLKEPAVYGTILAILLFLLIGIICGTQIFEAIIGAKQWFLDNPLLSIPWYCFLFSVASAIFLPYGPFCISIGYIWGLGWGLPVQLCAIFVSSGFIYVVGRVLLKKRVNEHTQKYRLWRAIMDRMGSDWKEAAKINILMCFIPMPYGTHAYLFSLSECSFINFVSVFELGMIGHTFLNLALGDALAMSAELGTDSTSTLQFVATLVGVVTMILSIWYGGIVTQRIMDEQYSEDRVLVKHDACSNDAVLGQPCPDLERGGDDAGKHGPAQALDGTQAGSGRLSAVELVLEAGSGSDGEQQSDRPAPAAVHSAYRAPTALAPAVLA